MSRRNFALRFLHRLHNDQGGTAAVTFLLCLPIFMWVVCIAVQMLLLWNAKIVVNDAALAAARAAMTSLPEEVPENIKKAACFMLVPISPKAKTGVVAEGTEMGDALETLEVNGPPSFAERYSYADAATTVDYPQRDYKHMVGQDIDVTVTYRFYITVPFAGAIFNEYNAPRDVIGGVNGRFVTIKATVRVQTAHGRAADADDTGLPYGN